MLLFIITTGVISMKKIRKIKDRSVLDAKIDIEYKDHISNIIKEDIFWSMDNYIQHGNITCLEHSLIVSYKSYKICKKLGLNHRSVARGGLLHDFFLYDWHIKDRQRKLHGFYHPHMALKNARERFDINPIEADIIVKHMWPLTVTLPLYKESLIVAFVDKYCALIETFYSGNTKYYLKKHITVTIDRQIETKHLK